MQFREVTLDNGLQIVAELNPAAQSVAAGFFVRTGARDETPTVNGVSHFLEHMAFKGNDRFTAADVNRIFDEVGARNNAQTSEEVTLYYAAILPEYLPPTFEILSVLLYPTLRQEDFDNEKKVILDEIGVYEDQPSSMAYMELMRAHFANHPLGLSILGTSESISALTSEQMRAYHREHYRAGNITLAVAGRIDWDDVLKLADQYCGHWPAGSTYRPTDEAKPAGGLKIISKSGSVQEHVMQLAPAPSARNDMRFAAELLAVVVGDDSGSRMYWGLVDPGYVEAAELGYNEYDGSGTWMTYLSTSPETTQENLERIYKICDDVNRNGVTETELNRAKSKVSSAVVLRSERPMGRLSSLGGNWVYRGEYRSVKDDLDTVKSITTADIRELLEVYPLGHTTTTLVGPLTSLNGHN